MKPQNRDRLVVRINPDFSDIRVYPTITQAVRDLNPKGTGSLSQSALVLLSRALMSGSNRIRYGFLWTSIESPAHPSALRPSALKARMEMQNEALEVLRNYPWEKLGEDELRRVYNMITRPNGFAPRSRNHSSTVDQVVEIAASMGEFKISDVMEKLSQRGLSVSRSAVSAAIRHRTVYDSRRSTPGTAPTPKIYTIREVKPRRKVTA